MAQKLPACDHFSQPERTLYFDHSKPFGVWKAPSYKKSKRRKGRITGTRVLTRSLTGYLKDTQELRKQNRRQYEFARQREELKLVSHFFFFAVAIVGARNSRVPTIFKNGVLKIPNH